MVAMAFGVALIVGSSLWGITSSTSPNVTTSPSASTIGKADQSAPAPMPASRQK
jgi:hypothetical protein